MTLIGSWQQELKSNWEETFHWTLGESETCVRLFYLKVLERFVWYSLFTLESEACWQQVLWIIHINDFIIHHSFSAYTMSWRMKYSDRIDWLSVACVPRMSVCLFWIVIIIVYIFVLPIVGEYKLCIIFTLLTTLCLKKTFPTFLTVTWKPIIRFWWFLVKIFLTQLVIKRPFSFPPHPTFVSALPGEITTSEISLFYPMRCDCLINITRKKTFCSHFWHCGWHFIQLSIFQLPTVKLFEVLAHYANTGKETLSPFTWQQYR